LTAAPPPPPAPPAPRSRPLGVAILAVLVGIFAVLVILGGIFILAGAAALAILGNSFSFGGLPAVAGGAIVLIVGIIILACALGLWHLRLWALVLALIVTFLEVVSYALSHAYLSLIIPLIIFIYLLAVHRHFH
jgi:hypothetical protein